jgi:hypothetical protein
LPLIVDNQNFGAKAYEGMEIGLAVVPAIGLAWAFRAFVLRTVAKIWIVCGSLDPADVIAILGGRLDVRPAAAAELYKRGISRRILVATAETDHGRHANSIVC